MKEKFASRAFKKAQEAFCIISSSGGKNRNAKLNLQTEVKQMNSRNSGGKLDSQFEGRYSGDELIVGKGSSEFEFETTGGDVKIYKRA